MPSVTARATGSNQNQGTIFREFPFPLNFSADDVIAIQDTNGNGIIDSYSSIGSPNISFPFNHNPVNGLVRGSSIGTAGSFNGAGGYLLYAQDIDDKGNSDPNDDLISFLWFAVPDPNVTNVVSPIDGGVGSFTRDLRTFNHATIVGSFVQSGDVAYDIPEPGLRQDSPAGTFTEPGSISGVVNRLTVSETRPGTEGTSITLSNLNITDVPFVREEFWGQRGEFPLFATDNRPQSRPAFQTIYSGGEQWGRDFKATSIAFGDIDGDGRDEFGVTREASANGRAFIYNDDGRLVTSHATTWGPDFYATDIAFGNSGSSGPIKYAITRKASVNGRHFGYSSNGRLLHQGGNGWGGDFYATAAAFGDIDGDGVDEYGITRKSTVNQRFLIFDDNGQVVRQGGSGWGRNFYGTDIAFGDIDGDGKDEYGVTRNSDNNARFFIYDDNGQLIREGGNGWGSSYYATSIAFGDIDGDGKDEYGITREADRNGRYFIYDDNGQLLVQGGAGWGANARATGIAFGDLDGDGDDEFGVSRRPPSITSPRYYIYDYENGQANLLQSGGNNWGNDSYAVDIAFGDTDGDNKDEIGFAISASKGPRYRVLKTTVGQSRNGLSEGRPNPGNPSPGGPDNPIVGTSSNDTLNGTSAADRIEGLAGNDTLLGRAGNDVLVGTRTDRPTPGTEVDSLTGNAGRDTFVLGERGNWAGNRPKVFYDDGNRVFGGASSYALITDFRSGEDRIQLRGRAQDYVLRPFSVSYGGRRISGEGIYRNELTDELIAVAQYSGQFRVGDLNLTNTNQFTYV